MKSVSLALMAVALSAAGGVASAATLSLVGEGYTTRTLNDAYEADTFEPGNNGVPVSTDAYNALDPAGVAREGSTVSVLTQDQKTSSNGLSVSGPAKVTFTYLGFESVFTNTLSVAGQLIFQNLTNGQDEERYSSVGESVTFEVVSGGLLDFIYETLTLDGRISADNGLDYAGSYSNTGVSTSTQGFFGVAFSALFNGGSSVIVMLDDGGDGPDSDYDDLTFRIDVEDLPIIDQPPVAPVPLPAAGLLLLGSLGGLSLLGRKRNRAA
jgi:hypothetical protein